MSDLLEQRPSCSPPLDAAFRPAALGDLAFKRYVARLGGAEPLELCLERDGGYVTRVSLSLSPRQVDAPLNRRYSERVLKFLLWQHGARRLFLAGPDDVTAYLARAYRPGGERWFDAAFMARVYSTHTFEVVSCDRAELPPQRTQSRKLGGQLTGCRIGFDAGGSDRKVAALIDGKQVFASETVWHPKLQSDPQYHHDGVLDSIRQALEHLPRLDGLGVSSAGIYIDNETRVASLFRRVPDDLFDARVRRIYLDIAERLAVPVQVANDGDVAALAGAMAIGDQPVLGLALGTSLAAGYVDAAGTISGALNELAFAPLDYAAEAPRDNDWSGDVGTGVSYLSQDAVIRLAERAQVELPPDLSPADKLSHIQRLFASKSAGATAIYETLGVYLGYALLQYAQYYRLKHVLLMGRVLSGPSGDLVLKVAKTVIEREAPDLAASLSLRLPDETTRRVGQSVAAASLVQLSTRKRCV